MIIIDYRIDLGKKSKIGKISFIGDKVFKGQQIAEVGSTGRSTGPHLDWRVNWFNQRLDPALLINE